MLPFIITPRQITVVINGDAKAIPNTHPNFEAVKTAIRTQAWDRIEDLADIPKAIVKYGQGSIKVMDDAIFYDDLEIHGALCDRILSMMREGFDVQPLVNFLSNLYKNPSKRAVDELYLFLEACDLPITGDGHFLAFKKVREDYKDQHSGRLDNSVGQVVSMERNGVDEDRDRTCSFGLHFCSKSYLPQYMGTSGKVMVVKINPADVVAIPSDYNNAKGRTCRYDVVGEVTYDWTQEHGFRAAVVTQYDDEHEDEPYHFTVKLRALDDWGEVHEGFITVTGDDEIEAKDVAIDEYSVDGTFDGADIDPTTVKAVSVTLIN